MDFNRVALEMQLVGQRQLVKLTAHRSPFRNVIQMLLLNVLGHIAMCLKYLCLLLEIKMGVTHIDETNPGSFILYYRTNGCLQP
jgi:hypothetical protein